MENNEKVFIGYQYSIRANYVFSKPVYDYRHTGKTSKHQNSLNNLLDNSTNGQMSDQSKRKLQNACNWLIISSLDKKLFQRKRLKTSFYKISFVTLTIPPQGDRLLKASEVKKILNSWLTYHRIYNKLNNYVWKLEEHKDGRLHIHLLTDTFLWHKVIKDTWNSLLLKNGLLKKHFQKYGNYNPNSTDVRAVKKAKNITAYIAKYMSKDNKKNENFTGRVWSCSYKISRALKLSILLDIDKVTNENKELYKPSIHWKRNCTNEMTNGILATCFFSWSGTGLK